MAPHPDHSWRWPLRLFLVAIPLAWACSTAAAWDLSTAWKAYSSNPPAFAPLLTFGGSLLGSLLTFAVAIIVAWAALGQLKTARLRHEAQTEADLQRRITESFLKAVEQLGSDKMPVRVGGIYSLERIAKESAYDYWTVMETLTAFVRQQARWKEGDPAPSGGPPTDIMAVMAVIERRSSTEKNLERKKGRTLDLKLIDLRGKADLTLIDLEKANLEGAHLEEAELDGAYLEKANLTRAHLEGASLPGAHLEGASLFRAHLEEASLPGAHLEGAFLNGAYLEKAKLTGAHLEGAFLEGAHLEGAFLEGAHLEKANLTGAHLEGAFLEGAHLEGAFLEGAHLEKANLEGADLIGALARGRASGESQPRGRGTDRSPPLGNASGGSQPLGRDGPHTRTARSRLWRREYPASRRIDPARQVECHATGGGDQQGLAKGRRGPVVDRSRFDSRHCQTARGDLLLSRRL